MKTRQIKGTPVVYVCLQEERRKSKKGAGTEGETTEERRTGPSATGEETG